MSNTISVYKKLEMFSLLDNLSSPSVFGGIHVANPFILLCCPIICLYVQRSVLFVGMTAHSCLFHVICVCLRIVVTNTYCLVFFL